MINFKASIQNNVLNHLDEQLDQISDRLKQTRASDAEFRHSTQEATTRLKTRLGKRFNAQASAEDVRSLFSVSITELSVTTNCDMIVVNSHANADITTNCDVIVVNSNANADVLTIVNVPTKNRFAALETDDDIIQTPSKKWTISEISPTYNNNDNVADQTFLIQMYLFLSFLKLQLSLIHKRQPITSLNLPAKT